MAILDPKPWDKDLQQLLAVIVALNILPHAWINPLWSSLTAFVCVTWKIGYLRQGWILPKKWVIGLGAAFATALTWFQFGTILGTEPASCLLVLLAGLKLLETNRYRDAMLVIFTSYFLLMAHLLSSQSLLSTLFMACDILFITSLMFHLHQRDRRNSIRGFRPAMRMLALVLPVWILFFFLFPRFTAAFWDLKAPGPGTGFSDRLSPGQIERLTESEDPAFRVTFSTIKNPNLETLYWRGDVLTQGDGLNWQKAEVLDSRPLLRPESPPPQTTYEVFLEPGFQRTLFVLEYVKRVRAGEWLARQGLKAKDDLTYQTDQDFQSRISYAATSSRESPVQSLRRKERELLLQLPTTLSERTKALAEKIGKTERERGPRRALALAERVMTHFSADGFRYSIRPGALRAAAGPAQLDEFLFEKKVGFCEHYAATFTTLMRLLNVPARVVIGFQGGRYNDFGNYLLVRHLDAHAWAEIWIDEGGHKGHWVRQDPTQQVAPLRLELGGDFNRLDSGQLAARLTGSELRQRMDPIARFLLKTQLGWDAVQMRWNAFLLEYDLSLQLELLERLGFKNASALLLIFILASGLILIGIGLVLILRRRAHRPDPIVEIWAKFCRRLARSGLTRKPAEGPLTFTERAAQTKLSVASEIREIGSLYMRLRYGSLTTEEQSRHLSQFRAQVRAFSPPDRP